MAWTPAEGTERSFTGAVNNKIPDASRKKAATPKKIQGVLGAMKAHMLKMGDQEGPTMLTSLKSCHKAIGEKFAGDAARAKKSK